MLDYEPIDLSPCYNAARDAYLIEANKFRWAHIPAEPPIGRQEFHGLPFQIGPINGIGNCYIVLGKGLQETPVIVPLNRTARYLIFAQVLLQSELWQGAQPGQEVARYRFHYDDGESSEAPIRERFEVGNIPLPWGQLPFLAVVDQKDFLMPRYEGRWEDMGSRQMEAVEGWPVGYFLWVWENPRPGAVIKEIELIPGRPRYIVAAITLSNLEEWPLVREARRPVKITLKEEAAAQRPFSLDVTVDRGMATFSNPLPPQPLEQIMPFMRGFGAPLNKASSPAYTEIAATPSATIRVSQDGEELGCARWGDVVQSGAVETPSMRVELVDPGKNWVRVKVVDDETGQQIACRVAFHSPEGVPYPPHGHYAPVFTNLPTWHIDVGGDLRLGQISYAYIDGSCQGWLPRGQVLVDVAKGYEYEPLREMVTIEPGQQELTLRMRRWIDMSAEHYYSGDSHVHFLSAQGSLNEAAGEDLNVVNMLQSQWGHLFTNTEEYTGRPQVSDDGRHVVFVSQENRQHLLGHLTLLGLKEPVMPWCTDGSGEAEIGGGLDITMSHWADACHAQGGSVIIPHLPTPNCEPAVLIATGRADAVEMLEHHPYEHLEYYRYLNGGYRLPLVGGTDKMSSSTPVGLYRTYVYIPPDKPFTYENWCAGMRSGRTFLSGGALIWLEVEGMPPGETLQVRGGGTVEVAARARSIFPLHTLQIVHQGKVVAETTSAEGSRNLELHARLKIEADSWLAARCAGPDYTCLPHFDQRNRGIFAHTSPVYLTTGSEYDVFSPETAQYMLTMIEGGLAYIRSTSRHYDPNLVTYHHGEADHRAYLEAPFNEAREAIHQRMHQLGIAH